MSTISIKDLPDSVALDRQAMQAITGGARSGLSANFSGRTQPGSERVVVYPPGFPASSVAKPGQPPSSGKRAK